MRKISKNATLTVTSSLNYMAHHIFDQLATQFPVCMASDEFHFFPQARADHHDWSKWDDFSDNAVKQIIHRLSGWNRALESYHINDSTTEDLMDKTMLRRIIDIVIEQLRDVGMHLRQPSLYLTILGVGLAEAAEMGPHALNARAKGIPGFMDQARSNLQRVPRLFRDIGLEMTQGFKPWIQTLDISESTISTITESLDRFGDHLHHIPTKEEFLLPKALFERIVFHHMDCRLDMDEISRQLEQEILATRQILERWAKDVSPQGLWQEAIQKLPRPELSQGGAKRIYKSTISDLASHCMAKGMISPDLVARCPVDVAYIPDHLLPVRSNAAFSMSPGHPPRGGTFFIMKEADNKLPPDWRLLAAHETFPGHHLLDTFRWNSKRPVRRHIEFPIYYEGWASFSEELLFDTGFFAHQTDTMLLAKRRFWRAMRGRVDMDIHTGKLTLEQAVDVLCNNGMERDNAAAMVRRYILKPGYQMAYTIGHRRFRRLYEKNRDPISFAHQVLSHGEIGFDHLEKILDSGG